MKVLEAGDFRKVMAKLLEWIECHCIDGPAVNPNGGNPHKRKNCKEAVLTNSLRAAVHSLNIYIPADIKQQAVDRVIQLPPGDLMEVNERFHHMLIHGITVQYLEQGEARRNHVRLVDFENPENNEYLAVTGFILEENQHRECLDVVLFINGLPLVSIAFRENAGIFTEDKEAGALISAYNRLQRWKERFPTFFRYNALLIISDGNDARVGTLSAGYNRFTAWRSVEAGSTAPASVNWLRVLTVGLLSKQVLLDMIKHFIVFEKAVVKVKKAAAYHQYHAVNQAIAATIRATSISGDQRCGVVWHTQGSGKSMTMLFYAARLAAVPELDNPTLLVITDRNDLDDQLFETFSASTQLLRQTPIQADNRQHLKQLLKRNSGGILFTTVQKFFPGRGKTHPLLSRRRNIIVIADEAHRSQYDFIDGFARHMRDALPNASFIGFTGTPLEREDRSTRAVFGDYIDIYDIQKAVEDRVTVPIYYESRLVAVALNEEEKTFIDTQFETVTRDHDPLEKKKLQSRWAKIEAILGNEKRLCTLSRDLVTHFEQRQKGLSGKALVVAVSRRVCIDLYQQIIRFRPGWHSHNDLEGVVKVVITGTSLDPAQWQPHIRDKTRRRVIGDRLKDPGDPLKIVIVCDMWLTGFDAPCLHTLYIDKPLKDHSLMQAIARVNRVFRDKPGGLVVDYLGIASQLKKALEVYIDSGGKGKPHFHQADAVTLMREKYEVVTQLLNGFYYKHYFRASPVRKNHILLTLQEHILSLEKGKELFTKEVTLLSRAFALSVPHPAALRLKDELALFQLVKARLNTFSSRTPGSRSDEAVETAVRQIVSKAVAAGDIIDIFDAAGIMKPGISILSEEFLAGIKTYPLPHVALELLKNLLEEEINTRARKNLVQGRSFLQVLSRTLQSYCQNQITTMEVIEQLIRLAGDIREADSREKLLQMTADELAFYDALTSLDGVLQVFPEETLKRMARELVKKVRKNTTIDWAVRESSRARLKITVKRTLRIYSYPMKGQSGVVETILKQAECLAHVYYRDILKNFQKNLQNS